MSGLSQQVPGAERIAELLRLYVEAPLPSQLINQISTYIDILLKWNRRVNLTAIRKPEDMVRRHFGESLFAARTLLAVADGEHAPTGGLAGSDNTADVIDVGSGAGFPGMVLKLYAPGLRLRLIESQGRKATFLREVIRSLELREVEVVQERAEHLVANRQGKTAEMSGGSLRLAEVVTLRAVEKFRDVLPVAASLVAPGGRLGVLIGTGQLSQAASVLPGKWSSLPMPQSENRVLAIWRPT